MRRLPLNRLSPFGRWYTREGISEEQIAAECTRRGVSCCTRYVRQIGNGTRTPSYPLAKTLSAITNGRVSVGSMMEWRRPDRLGMVA